MAGSPIYRKPSVKVFKSTAKNQNYLIIPDLHFPYENHNALSFCTGLRDLYDIPDTNIIQLGDIEDNFAFGAWPKGADFPHTPNQEIEITRDKIKLWAKEFPELKICNSNHQSRFYRKAAGGELPSQVLRNYKELFGYPKRWDVQECFLVDTKMRFLNFHGEGFATAIMAAMHYGVSTIMGHLHSKAGVQWLNTAVMDLYAVNSGCLIDIEAYCFAYAKHAKAKPTLGATVILDSGRCPLFHPLIF